MAQDKFDNPDGIAVKALTSEGAITGASITATSLVVGANVEFTITNDTEGLAIDADTAADAELADVLCTLIRALAAKGLVDIAA